MNNDKNKHDISGGMYANRYHKIIVLVCGFFAALSMTACGHAHGQTEKDEIVNIGDFTAGQQESSVRPGEGNGIVNTEKSSVSQQESNVQSVENTDAETKEKIVESDEEPQAAQKDVSGIYTDKQGTSDVYSELVLALQPDGTYAAEIGIYRVTTLEGTAVWKGDTLHFTSEDTDLEADISVTGSRAEVTFTTGGVLGIQAGAVCSFPDGAPDEAVAGQAGNAAFQPSLSDEIAAELSNAEEREKEITEKQKAADTQMDMNIAAAELYQMWDDTLNRVWGLLEANLSETDMEVLRKEEREWIAFKDAEVQAAGQECGGGSIQPSVEAATAADLTKTRVYELAGYAE